MAADGSDEMAFAVRLDWPDGTHEFVKRRWSVGWARRAARGQYTYWRGGPLRPVRVGVVQLPLAEFRLHQTVAVCRSPRCPQPVEVIAAAVITPVDGSAAAGAVGRETTETVGWLDSLAARPTSSGEGWR